MSGNKSDKISCPCTRCQGALVTTRTFWTHNKANARDVPSFSDWSAPHEGEPSRKRQRKSDEDNESDDNEIEWNRPAVRN